MVNIAVIGTGRIGAHHVQALSQDVRGAQVVAVVDPARDRAEALADQFQVPHALGGIDEALQLDDVDAVVIATPVPTHLPLIEAAAARGKHTFTEKPLGGDIDEARRAAAAAESAGIVFQVGFNRRFAESWSRAHDLVATGAVGAIHRVHSVTRDPGPFAGDPSRIAPGTVFRETLIHDFDTIGWLLGDARPVTVYAAADALVAPEAKDSGFLDSAVVTIRYDNGAIATAEASFSASYGYDLRGEVFGSAGMVQMGELPNSAARLFTTDGMHATTDGIDTVRFHDAYVAEFEAFIRAIEGDDSSGRRPVGADGVAAQVLAEAAIRSHAQQRVVEVEEVLA